RGASQGRRIPPFPRNRRICAARPQPPGDDDHRQVQVPPYPPPIFAPLHLSLPRRALRRPSSIFADRPDTMRVFPDPSNDALIAFAYHSTRIERIPISRDDIDQTLAGSKVNP